MLTFDCRIHDAGTFVKHFFQKIPNNGNFVVASNQLAYANMCLMQSAQSNVDVFC